MPLEIQINNPQSAQSSPPIIGRIVSVTGAQAIVLLDQESASGGNDAVRAEMGTLVKVGTQTGAVLGLVSALSVPVPATTPNESEVRVLELELVGELPKREDGSPGTFKRGITNYPVLGDLVFPASRRELDQAYAHNEADSIRVGTIHQDASIPAMIRFDDMLGKHFAVLGSTGTGKSCAVALLLRAVIDKNPNAHIVVLDPHSEYASSFGERAEVITPATLDLPFWLLTFEEISEIFVGHHPAREIDIEVLGELIPLAKSRYAASGGRERANLIHRQAVDVGAYSVDSPVPYRISDLIHFLDEYIGKLDHQGSLAPFKRLKSRIGQYSRDPRYTFMFGNLTVQDTMAKILGRIFRVPVNGKPVTIIDLAGLPSEIVNVTVSVICRMTFDFGLWSEGKVPVTLVCEEAHRYVPADTSLGFEPTKRAISRIAKEGRKYGISLCIVSQRACELAPTILSQCNTIIAMRLSNEKDQDILKAAISDAASSMLEFLPSMGNREAIAFGEGVALPTRLRFDTLPEDAMPTSRTKKFSEGWANDVGDTEFLNEIVTHWRARTRNDDAPGEVESNAAGQPAPQTDAPQVQPAPSQPQPQPDPASARAGGPSMRRQPAETAGPPATTDGFGTRPGRFDRD